MFSLSEKCNRMEEIKSFSCTKYTYTVFLLQMHVEHSAIFLKFTNSFMKLYFSPGFTTPARLSFQSLLLPHHNLYHMSLREKFCFLGVQRYYSKPDLFFNLTPEQHRRHSEAAGAKLVTEDFYF